MVPALVLTAGPATRLRPLSLVRAKAALPVAGVPLIRRILGSLAAAGIADVVLNLHHLPHTLTAIVGDGSDLGLAVRYSWETPVLGSAGGPKRALPLLAGLGARDSGLGETVLIVNGDTLTNVDLRGLVEEHRQTGALVTLAVIRNADPDKYGGVTVSGDGAVTGFAKRGSREPSFLFIGVQAVEPETFATVPPGVPYETVGTLYPSLLASRPGLVRAFRTTAEFMDIGTPADYLATSLLLEGREPTSRVEPRRAVVSPSASIERSVLWDDVVVEDGARLSECVVTDGVRVPPETSWHRVSLRIASGELMPQERRMGGLAIAAI